MSFHCRFCEMVADYFISRMSLLLVYLGNRLEPAGVADGGADVITSVTHLLIC